MLKRLKTFQLVWNVQPVIQYVKNHKLQAVENADRRTGLRDYIFSTYTEGIEVWGKEEQFVFDCRSECRYLVCLVRHCTYTDTTLLPRKKVMERKESNVEVQMLGRGSVVCKVMRRFSQQESFDNEVLIGPVLQC